MDLKASTLMFKAHLVITPLTAKPNCTNTYLALIFCREKHKDQMNWISIHVRNHWFMMKWKH